MSMEFKNNMDQMGNILKGQFEKLDNLLANSIIPQHQKEILSRTSKEIFDSIGNMDEQKITEAMERLNKDIKHE